MNKWSSKFLNKIFSFYLQIILYQIIFYEVLWAQVLAPILHMASVFIQEKQETNQKLQLCCPITFNFLKFIYVLHCKHGLHAATANCWVTLSVLCSPELRSKHFYSHFIWNWKSSFFTISLSNPENFSRLFSRVFTFRKTDHFTLSTIGVFHAF